MSEAIVAPDVAVVADFTLGSLTGLLDHGEEPHLTAVVAPFDRVIPTLLDPAVECWAGGPHAAFVWTRPQAAIRGYARILNHEPVAIEDLLAEVDAFVEALKAAASRVSALFVANWTLPPYDRGLGILDWDARLGRSYCLARMNARLAESTAAEPKIRVLDASRWVARAGAGGMSPKLWHLGKIAFGPEVLEQAASDIKAAFRALRGQTKKLVIVDLDETLWGGIVGDVGWQQLRLGGHDPVGEAFVDFQRALKRLTNRGVVLGIVSKNTEAVALEAIDNHPAMVLRRTDFAGWRINWDDKANNIADLAEQLSLGLESVVFIDDNPAERSRVQAALPKVTVPEWPKNPLLYGAALAGLTWFDTFRLTEEDRARARMYASERERSAARESAQSIDEYLASLGLVVTSDRLSQANLARAAQLLNKTNQMNLSTRRMSETAFSEWSSLPSHATFVFTVSDRFDEYGLTGIASVTVGGQRAEVTDFVLSCRVMGRGVEEAMLWVLVDHARSLGVTELVVPYSPTAKNAPCKLFLDQKSGLELLSDGRTYSWNPAAAYPSPSHIQILSPSAAR
jgi:FkbH-like protein